MSNAPLVKLKRGQHRTPGSRMRPFQKNAIRLLTEQALSGTYKPIEETLLEAGYALESAKQITNVMAGIRQHVDPIVARMEAHREKVMERMEEAVTRATYGELVRSLDVSTRNIRLLTGKSTHNFALNAEHRQRLDALIQHDA